MNTFPKLSGIISEKDIDSVVIKCNQTFLDYAGVKSDDLIIGRTDYDFPWYEYADLYRAHELDAINGNNYSAIMPFKDYTGKNLILLHTKTQILDKSNIPVGVLCHSIELVNQNIYKLVDAINKNTKPNNVFFLNKKSKIQLPKRQEEVLFYLVRGKSAKLIARIMNISYRTVEAYVDILKGKLNCQTRAELIEIAIDSGYAQNISSDENILNLIKKIEFS